MYPMPFPLPLPELHNNIFGDRLHFISYIYVMIFNISLQLTLLHSNAMKSLNTFKLL